LKISAAMPNQQCQATAYQRPCKKWDGSNIPDYYPADWPCPCPTIAGDGGGAFVGNGKPSTTNAYSDEFEDVVLADGFDKPVNVIFSKNGLFFVTTKPGQVWKVDRGTGQKTLWLDIAVSCGAQKKFFLQISDTSITYFSKHYIILILTYSKDEVNDSGDRGLLGIALDPDYPNTPDVYLWYTYGHASMLLLALIPRYATAKAS